MVVALCSLADPTVRGADARPVGQQEGRVRHPTLELLHAERRRVALDMSYNFV